MARGDHLWWQRGIIHQIYPRSFRDGDGTGDLRGIESRLDSLAWLGVDANLAVADLPLPDGRLRRPDGGGAPPRAQGHPRLRPQPHLRSPSVVRKDGDRRCLVVLNLAPRPETFGLTTPGAHGCLVPSTHPGREGEAVVGQVELRGDEEVIVAFA